MEASNIFTKKDQDINNMIKPNKKLVLYHASNKEIPVQEINFPGPRGNCDFGSGFYLTDNKFTAEEWVFEENSPVINMYTFSAPPSSILHLTGEDWIRVVVGFRTGKYKVLFSSPVVQGTIADDRLVTSLIAFLAGDIGDRRLLKSLDYCKLGDQFLLRNDASCLGDHSSKILKGLELQQAADRFRSRRKNMNHGLTLIRRESFPEEKYIEHYLEMGDYCES